MLAGHLHLHLPLDQTAGFIQQVHIDVGGVAVADGHTVAVNIQRFQSLHVHSCGLLVENREVLTAQAQTDGAGEIGHGLVGNIDGQSALFQEQTHGHGGIELPGGVVQSLVPAAGVHAGPACHGPAVVELPVDGAHTPAPLPAEMLHAVLDGVGLEELGCVDQILEFRGIQVIVGEVAQDLAVAALALLVVLHDPGEAVVVLLFAEGADGLHAGECLEAVLGAEAEVHLPVGGEGHAAVPDGPVVGVAPGMVAGIVETAAAGGAGGPVEGVGSIPLADLRQEDLVEVDVVVTHMLGVLGTGVDDHVLHLVVAAEDGKGRMMVQAVQVVDGLGGEFLPHLVGEPDVGAGHHEVLPDHDALLVAEVVELVLGVVAAAPDAERIEIGVDGPLDVVLQTLVSDPAEQIVHGDVVGAHGEDLHAVDDECELTALFVGVLLGADRQGPQADALFHGIDDHALMDQLDKHIVQGLFAKAADPPEPGIFHGDGHFAVHDLLPPAVDGHIDLALPTVQGFGPDSHIHHAVVVVLCEGGAVEPVMVVTLQLHGSPDAHIGERGAPVPAGLVHGLAQVGCTGDGVAVVHVQVMAVLFPGEIPGGRLEIQPEDIFARHQPFVRKDHMGPVHILHPVHENAVQVDVADGVEAVEDQFLVFLLQLPGGHGELRLEVAVPVGKELQLPLVETVVGIGDLAVFVQHAQHGAGGRTGQRLKSGISKSPVLDVHIISSLRNGDSPIIFIGLAGVQGDQVPLFLEDGDLSRIGGQTAPGLDADVGRIGPGPVPQAQILHPGEADGDAVAVARTFQSHFSRHIPQDDGIIVKELMAQA